MDRDRWHRIQEIFHAALAVSDAERAGMVERACVADEEMARMVWAMLEADARSALLDADVASVARDVLQTSGDDAAVDTTIGPYRIKAVLGEGGSGVVYLAVRDDIGQDVAHDIGEEASPRGAFLRQELVPAVAVVADGGSAD